MPAKSEKQYKFMQMIAHGGKSRKVHSSEPSPEVAKKFIDETSKKDRSRFMKKR